MLVEPWNSLILDPAVFPIVPADAIRPQVQRPIAPGSVERFLNSQPIIWMDAVDPPLPHGLPAGCAGETQPARVDIRTPSLGIRHPERNRRSVHDFAEELGPNPGDGRFD